jgi:hypothetical protein
MSSCITRSIAEWIPGDAESRKLLDNAVYSAIGNTEEKSNGLPEAVLKIIIGYLKGYRCFGASDWSIHCGRVDPAPPLPHDFSAIWNRPCPILPKNKIKKTHMLVYLPATVDGKPFTLKKLVEIAKRHFPQNNGSNEFIWIWLNCIEVLGDKPIDKSGWVLMPKDVLPGSRKKCYDEQQKIVAELARQSLIDYKPAGTLEAATCFLLQYLKTRLFNNNLRTFTCCKDKVQGWQTVVGIITLPALSINSQPSANEDNGIAPLVYISIPNN